MKSIERVFYVSILAILGSLCFQLGTTPSSKASLLFAQERPTPSRSIAQEQKEVDMEFSVEGQELIVFRYSGKNSDDSRVQSYLMIFPSGHLGYWYHNGKGAYLYNNHSDIWMYANFSTKEKALVNTDYGSYEKVDHKFERSYSEEDCTPLKLRDLNWGSHFDVCSQALSDVINNHGNKEVKTFKEKYLNKNSMQPFIEFFNLSKYVKKGHVLTHRWQYTSTKTFHRNLDLISIKYYKSLDEVRKNLGLTVPLFNLMKRSETVPVCKAFQC